MKIIPTPQYCEYTLCEGKNLFEKVKKVFVEQNLLEKCQAALGLLGDFTASDKQQAELIITDSEETASLFFAVDKDWFSNPNAAEQGYIIKGTADGKTVIYAPNFMGIMYGIATFLQIPAVKNGFLIKDYPDFQYRAIKWLLWAETAIFSYDFCDGLENLLARVERKLDFCLKYKINMIFFDACGADADRTPQYKTFMKTCTRMARKRGIHLIVCTYGMGYGLSGHPFGKYFGKVFKNMTDYPNGDVYECLGTFIHNSRNGGKPFLLGREYGTCISNEALLEDKLQELREYIRQVNPGALYLHNMDSSFVDKMLWGARCENCRKKWPNDDLFAKDGMAGAFAEFFDKLNSGLQSVKTEDYDSAKDLLIFNVAPGYLEPKVEDYRVEDASKFWAAVQSYQTVKQNVIPLFREMFYNKENDLKRIPDIVAKQVERFGVIAFAGSDGYYSDKLFSLSASLSYMYKGAKAVITCSGNAFCEPLAVFNAEYMWNCENSAFYKAEVPVGFEAFFEQYDTIRRRNIYPDEVYEKGGMLDVICQKLYGEDSEKMHAFFSLRGENCEAPAPFACNREMATDGINVLLPYRWDNELSEQELCAWITKIGQIKKVNEQGILLLADGADSDVKEYHRLLSLNNELVSAIYEYLVLYQKACAFIADGTGEQAALIESLQKLSAFTSEKSGETYEAVDALGGAFTRRTELFEILTYNCSIMCDSINSGKRIPDTAKELQDKNWW